MSKSLENKKNNDIKFVYPQHKVKKAMVRKTFVKGVCNSDNLEQKVIHTFAKHKKYNFLRI